MTVKGGVEMPKQAKQKLKLLYIMRILLEETDENHTITVNEIIKKLEVHGIAAERRSIYDDLELLRDCYGLDIEKRKTKTHDYYVASRDFELPEIKLLVDTVEASRFITHKKSMELIKKLTALTSHHNESLLRRQVHVYDRVKNNSELIYYSVDAIHEAISTNRKITFQYFDRNLHKEKVLRKEGKFYVKSPIALTFDSDNYYLVVYECEWKQYAYYRVDRMQAVSVLPEERELPEAAFDLMKELRPVFRMYGGQRADMCVEFSNELAGPLMDKFGQDIIMVPKAEERFEVHFRAAISPPFLSWLIGFGNKAKVISPPWVIDEMKCLMSEVTSQYE